ncbi:MAG: ATPase, T2SS/T4P/T4SS family [Pseudomonadota bacterium]
MSASGGNGEAEFVDGVIESALRENASSVHFEYSGPSLVVQYRRGDRLAEITRLPSGRGSDVVRQIKNMANMEPADNGQSEIGRIIPDQKDLDAIIEVSVLQYQDKERIVLEFRKPADPGLSLDLPGLTDSIHALLVDALAEPKGIILVTGPEDSAKTNMMYALLEQLRGQKRHICTVENSPSRSLEGVVQMDISQQDIPDFSNGLRAILRQDPDVVMLGEIPDSDTADIAVRAAMDGCLILSAVPADNAVGAITRMQELQVDSFFLASSLRAVVAQRVVRQLCPHCAEPVQADGSLASLLGFDRGEIVYRETGCGKCGHSGFSGEIGVFEAVRVDETIRKIIAERGDESRIASLAFLKQPDLASAARKLVKQGKITAEDGIQISRMRHAMVID